MIYPAGEVNPLPARALDRLFLFRKGNQESETGYYNNLSTKPDKLVSIKNGIFHFFRIL